jgi:hypothetical protein
MLSGAGAERRSAAADVGGALAAQRLFACGELRGKRATYT